MKTYYLAVDKDGQELKSTSQITRHLALEIWIEKVKHSAEYLEQGTIEKLTGKKLTWEDEPIEYKEEN